MKTRFSLFFVVVLLLTSCSQEETINELNTDTNHEANKDNPGNRGFGCEPDYPLPIYNPLTDWMYSITWTIHYAPHLTPEQINCIRIGYFSQSVLALKMNILQPTDPHIDSWKLIPGYPSQSTSGTIDDDPRLTVGNGSGG